jgi:hypothetical protein
MTATPIDRHSLARLAAERGVECEDVMRLGDLATAVACERAYYRDAVLALFRTEAGQHRAFDPAGAAARVVVFEANEADGVLGEAPPDGLSVTTPGGSDRWTIATEALTAHLFAGPPIEVFLAVRGRPEDAFAFRVHLSVALHRALLLLDRLFLHAAGVRFAGTCYAFVGDKGTGKSTLSLALGAAGAAVLADDHVVLRRDGDRFLASGCDGEARLLDDSEHHLFGAPVDARVVELGGVRKKEIPVGRYFASDPYREHRLDRLVFPSVGETFGVRRMSKRDALVGLIRATRSSHRFSNASDYGAYLDYLSSLVDSVDTFSLELSPNLSELDRLVDWVRDGVT